MARKKNAPVLRNNLRNEPAEKFRTVNRMNGIVTMIEYTSEDDIKAYELEPTYRELTGGGGGDLSFSEVTLVSSDGLSHSVSFNLFQVDNPDYCTGMYLSGRGYTTSGLNLHIDDQSHTANIVIMPYKYIMAICPPAEAISDYIVTGDAEVATETVEGETYKFVKIYGTCSITLVP